MARLPIAIASYSASPPSPIGQRHVGWRIAACLAIGAAWLAVVVLTHGQPIRGMFVVKLLAAPFLFAFVVAAVEIPRQLLVPAATAGRGSGGVAVSLAIAVGAVAFVAVSGAIGYVVLR